MSGRIVGIGQALAGDDGVGLAVIAHLRARAPRDLELVEAPDPTALVPLLSCAGPVVIVDALLATPEGRVREVAEEELEALGAPLSSHGMSVSQAIALGRLLAGEGFTPRLRIVGVTIARPRHQARLSPVVARAVAVAADLALALA